MQVELWYLVQRSAPGGYCAFQRLHACGIQIQLHGKNPFINILTSHQHTEIHSRCFIWHVACVCHLKQGFLKHLYVLGQIRMSPSTTTHAMPSGGFAQTSVQTRHFLRCAYHQRAQCRIASDLKPPFPSQFAALCGRRVSF
jgi:hypothetical protein